MNSKNGRKKGKRYYAIIDKETGKLLEMNWNGELAVFTKKKNAVVRFNLDFVEVVPVVITIVRNKNKIIR